MDIPAISDQLSPAPQAFPDCCLGLSSTLIAHLASRLPPRPQFTLSVGCGSGLLEALLAHRHPEVPIRGIEVASSVNRYIAEPDLDVVGGTWDLHASAPHAGAWMFVYPREPKLIAKYIESYGDQGAVETILWLGPRADWADYEPCFRHSSFSDVTLPDEVGLMPFEMLAIMKRRTV
ncbi:hypothetical protein BO70DRAFT_396293 [Aspergillus heteromorphus CBS 117.55]|uniref:S-adenosyl-L-methionine-dependent methyltransferase n=1 Tax=Aspergillus heteromorphus CBS 117.55 TaxID=1448321 RepID=A0A317W6L6_9EURO|nr:uncharacterized protein BO70DRAFT_396293 [Aspergillus heteromorphus CBS 117.55]PWY82003.1 hypothetical protein BO70DRAFT_396293 [Aspergillus heteromorphus CBS 117.55]